MSKTDGQIAHEAYAEQVGSEEYELLTWDQLTVTVKAGWETAAEAVIQALYAREAAAARIAAPDDKLPARVSYEAAVARSDRPMPAWDDLPADSRQMWQDVAEVQARRRSLEPAEIPEISHAEPHFMRHPLTDDDWCQCPCRECCGHVEGLEGLDCLCPACGCHKESNGLEKTELGGAR